MANKSAYCAALYENGKLRYEFHYRAQWETSNHAERWCHGKPERTALIMRDGLYTTYVHSTPDISLMVRPMTHALLRSLLPAETCAAQNDLHFAKFGHVFPYRA